MITAADALGLEYLRLYPAEINDWLNDLPADEALPLLDALVPAVRARVWEQMPLGLADSLFHRLDDDAATGLLELIDPTRGAQLLRRLSDERHGGLLGRLTGSTGRELSRLLSYPPGTAATLMDPRPPALAPQLSVGEALARVRGEQWHVTRAVYLVDDAGELMGQATLQDMALSDPQGSLLAIRKPVDAVVDEMATRDEIGELLEQQKLLELPVLDARRQLVGVIRYQSLINAVQSSVSADIQTMVGVSEDERAFSPISFAVRKRLPWLHINLLTAFLAAAVVGLFEGTIAQVTALAVLLPIVAGQSGNTGAQALAVTMRGLALREISVRHWLRMLRKEVGAGFINGIVVSLTTAVVIALWYDSLALALVIASSMVVAMVIACLAGTLIPIILTQAGQDPAQSSSIILTTVTDVVGFFAFLGIATLFMPYL